MASGRSEVWERVRAHRMALADELEGLDEADLDAPSWCDGWRVRDVFGHLVHLAEASQWSMTLDVLRNGMRPDPALQRVARRLGDLDPAALATRLRAGADGRYHVPGSPASVTLGEVLVHRADALCPLGRPPEGAPEDAAMVLDAYRRAARVAFHASAPRGVQLVADDADWRAGTGPEVRGRAVALLLLLANRRQVVGELTGPGVARLSG